LRTLPIKPTAVWSVVKEIRAAGDDVRPVLVSGAPEHARPLREALVAGGDEHAVRDLSGRKPTPYDVQGGQVLVHVVEGPRPSEADEAVLRIAARNGVEVICVLVGEPAAEPVDVPYVLATDVLEVTPGESLRIEPLAERIAARAGEKGYALAARLPVLRRAVCEDIVRGFSRQNGLLAAAIFIPGADLPVLLLNQIRMVFRIAAAHGESIDRERAFELLPVIAAGFGFRALARSVVSVVPVVGWAAQGAVAFAATRALGEAAIAYFEAGGTKRLEDLLRSVRSRS
jgi:uncharacterized protein (DUF697 family)